MGKNNTIYYLNTKEKLVLTLKQLYEPQGYTFVPLHAEEGLPDELHYLLLIEPLNLNREYYSVNQLWKSYLYKHRPETKLIVATFAQSQHANIFPLLSFPEKLEAFLVDVKPIADYPFVHIGAEEKFGEKSDNYMDSWTIYLPHSGRPSIKEMQHFLDGHDRNKSFSAQLFRMRSLLRNWQSSSEEEQCNSLDELKKEYGYLLQRWYYYEMLFCYLPFADTMKRISENLFSVKRQLDEHQTPGPTAQEKLTQIYQLTQDVIKPIVFPLDYW